MDTDSFDNTYGIGVVYVVLLSVVDTKYSTDAEAKEEAIDAAKEVISNMDTAITSGILQSELRASARDHKSKVLETATVSKSYVPLSYMSVVMKHTTNQPTPRPSTVGGARVPVEEREDMKDEITTVHRYISHSIRSSDHYCFFLHPLRHNILDD